MKGIILSRILLLLSAAILFTFTFDTQAVGFQHVMVPASDGASLEAGIWYPSPAVALPVDFGVVTQTVAIDAPVDGNALPLIVISHGTGGSYLSHYDTAIALANAGFIVAAVTHTGDNYADQSRSLYINDRPRHIARMLDYVLSAWPANGHINPARIGIYGFSAGGYTALVSIGGHPDMAKIPVFCLAHADDFACQLIKSRTGDRSLAMPNPERNRDVRIKAAVVAAPALGFVFAPDGLKEVTVPIQLWRAGNDVILPHPWYAEAVRTALPAFPDYHVVTLAGHFDFLAPCNERLAARAPEICLSAPGFDRGEFHKTLNRSIVDFFKKSL